MSSPERLAALLRQRALVSQHLAWLDAEILAASGVSAPEITPAPAAAPAPLVPPAPFVAPPLAPALAEPPPSPAVITANARADEILERYRSTEALNPAQTRRSCLLLFAALCLFGLAGVLGIYLLRYHGQ